MAIKWTEADVIKAMKEALLRSRNRNNSALLLQQLKARANELRRLQGQSPTIQGK